MEAELRNLYYQSIRDFGASESIAVAYPNKPFDNSKLVEYLRVNTLPTEPRVRGIKNGWSIYVWLLQVAIYVKDGIGEVKPLAVADKLELHLPYNTKLVGDEHEFTVISPPTPLPPVPTDGWFFIPVQFRIQAIH